MAEGAPKRAPSASASKFNYTDQNLSEMLSPYWVPVFAGMTVVRESI